MERDGVLCAGALVFSTILSDCLYVPLTRLTNDRAWRAIVIGRSQVSIVNCAISGANLRRKGHKSRCQRIV